MNDQNRKFAINALDSQEDRVKVAIDKMDENKAYKFACEQVGGDPDGSMLISFQKRFSDYRQNWREQPKKLIDGTHSLSAMKDEKVVPLSVDIEVASVCDLACPFCYRQHVATPDSLMKPELCFNILDQCADLGVPSVKFNWRGEPLLNPKLPEFIHYAKRNGILDTIINTNAVTLDEKKARQIIEAGLDLMIYSFDGGSKESYEKMRPGRFNEVLFEDVYENIKTFSRVRDEMGAVFPRTKIQMILTEETFKEQEKFLELFNDYVDDVSVKAYTERGGDIADLDDDTFSAIKDFVSNKNLSLKTPYWKDSKGDIYISEHRLPCEQVFQRMMVTTDGSVAMCCYDWGVEYPIGYVDQKSIDNGDLEYEKILSSVESNKKGFVGFMDNISMPKRYSKPKKIVSTLSDVWYGGIVSNVREKHLCGQLEKVEVCTRCPFKETYKWVKI
jgi:MoaA/NifB/PqqE/SkfB family radical SAM enzyme